MTFASAAVLVLLPLVAVGCVPRETDPLPGILERAALLQPVEPPPPLIHLVDRGTSTRESPARALRYAFGALPSAIEIDVRSSQGMRTLRSVLSLVPMKTDPEGTLRFEFRLVDAKLLEDGTRMDDAVVAKMTAAITEVQKLFGTELVTNRGIIREFGWNMPAELSLAARQIVVDTSRALRQLYPTVPEEPIGVGARWTIEQDNRTPGYATKTESTFVVTALDASSADLAVKVKQVAGRQELVTASSKKQHVDLAKLRGEGEGKFHVTFEPATSSATTKLTMVSNLDVIRRTDTAKLAMSTSSETSWKALD